MRRCVSGPCPFLDRSTLLDQGMRRWVSGPSCTFLDQERPHPLQPAPFLFKKAAAGFPDHTCRRPPPPFLVKQAACPLPHQRRCQHTARCMHAVPQAGIPLLVLGNKNDLPEALSANELITRLGVRCMPLPSLGMPSLSLRRAPRRHAIHRGTLRQTRLPPPSRALTAWPVTPPLAAPRRAQGGGGARGVRLLHQLQELQQH